MAKVEDCPGFETFGADVKAARKVRRLARKALAEMVGIEWRYLANIENKGTIPSLPVVIQLIGSMSSGKSILRYRAHEGRTWGRGSAAPIPEAVKGAQGIF